MSWIHVKIADCPEPDRVFQLSDVDFIVDKDGNLAAFSMFSARYNAVLHLVLNKKKQSVQDWQAAFKNGFDTLTKTSLAAGLGATIGLIKRPAYGLGLGALGTVAGLFASWNDLSALWKNVEAHYWNSQQKGEKETGDRHIEAGYYNRDNGAYITTFPNPIAVKHITLVQPEH